MHRRAGSLALVALIVAAIGCGNGGDESSPETETSTPAESTELRFADDGAKFESCSDGVAGQPARSPCVVAYEVPEFRKCPDVGSGGGTDIEASGVPCSRAQALRLPAGGFPIRGYAKPVENVFRPWIASGRFTDPSPERAIGWTCAQNFDPRGTLDGVRYLCWNDSGGMAKFVAY